MLCLGNTVESRPCRYRCRRANPEDKKAELVVRTEEIRWADAVRVSRSSQSAKGQPATSFWFFVFQMGFKMQV